MQGYDNWKLSYPPEWDEPEPTEEQYERALKFFLDCDIEASDSRVQEKAQEFLTEDIADSKKDAEEYQAAAREDDYYYDLGRYD